jgi:hypothetical protein
MMRLYLETNYLVGQAFNQDPQAAQIVGKAARVGAALAVSFNCIQEALRTLEAHTSKRHKCADVLKQEIAQVRTDQSGTLSNS